MCHFLLDSIYLSLCLSLSLSCPTYYTLMSFHLSPGSICSSTFSSSMPFLPQSSLLFWHSFGTLLLCHLLICLPLHIAMLLSFFLFFLAIHTVAGLGFPTLLSPPKAVASPQFAFTSPVLTLLSIPSLEGIERKVSIGEVNFFYLDLLPLFWCILPISPAFSGYLFFIAISVLLCQVYQPALLAPVCALVAQDRC